MPVPSMSADSFKVGGSVEWDIQDDYQDQHFQKNVSNISMKMTEEEESLDIKKLYEKYNSFRQPHSEGNKVEQKPLPYPMNGLEPIIPEKLLNLHYEKHRTCVNMLNDELPKIDDAIAVLDEYK